MHTKHAIVRAAPEFVIPGHRGHPGDGLRAVRSCLRDLLLFQSHHVFLDGDRAAATLSPCIHGCGYRSVRTHGRVNKGMAHDDR